MSVVEIQEGPRLRGGAVEFIYHVYGEDSILDARDALLDNANTPEEFDNLPRNPQPDIDPLGIDSWKAIVRYGALGDGIGGAVTGSEQYNFAIGGGTVRVRTSLSVESFGTNAPDTGALLGVVSDGAGGWVAEGLDVNVPTSEFGITRYIPASQVDEAYQILLEDMAWTVNDATFRGRAAGEVMFIGATGNRRETMDDYEINFRFARRKNRSDVVVPGSPANITVTGVTTGWQYLESIERQGKLLGVKRHTNYFTSDFSNLGIPVS